MEPKYRKYQSTKKLQNYQVQYLKMCLDLLLKKWVKLHDQSGNAEDRYKPSKQIRSKTSILRSDLCDFSDVYIILTGNITLTKKAKIEFMRNRLLAFKYNASLPVAYQRSIMY